MSSNDGGATNVPAVLARYVGERAAELARLREEISAGTAKEYEKELRDLECWHREAVDARAIVNNMYWTLRIFVGAAVPVSTLIDGRGYSWSKPYLDQALPEARRELAAYYGTAAAAPSGASP